MSIISDIANCHLARKIKSNDPIGYFSACEIREVYLERFS